MKKIKAAAIIILCMIIVFCIFVLCTKDTPKITASDQGTDIYYIDIESSSLKAEKGTPGGETNEEVLLNTINLMTTKPSNENLFQAIPEQVGVNGVYLMDNTAVIDFSSEYKNISKSQEMLLRGALTWTVSGLNFVDDIKITIDGQPLLKSNGEEYGNLNMSNTVISPIIAANPVTTVKVVNLYFPKSDYSGLLKEERRIEVNKTQPIEKYVMEELIKGPSSEEGISLIPSDTKVKNISTTDGICYVDLSQEFVNKNNNDDGTEELMVKSIVYSLTELSNTDKVQFLIEGERQEEYKGITNFGQPFSGENDSKN